MKKALLLIAVLLAAGLGAEPYFKSVSVTTTSATEPLLSGSQDVLLINDGAETVFYRLFTSCDTQGPATASNIPLQADEFKQYKFNADSTDACGPGGYYAAVSVVTSTGTATLRLESK